MASTAGRTIPTHRTDKYKGFLASSLKVDAYDCSTTAFTGGMFPSRTP